jgi:predicted enzyme related to lactoylglutathione lyase
VLKEALPGTQKGVLVMSNSVVHWEIGGPDSPALRDFYGKAFGWQMTDGGPNYTLVQTGDDGLAGGIMQTREGMPAYVTIYVAVDDLEAKLAEIDQLGGHTVVPPTKINEVAAFALFADPQGTVVGLLESTGPILAGTP